MVHTFMYVISHKCRMRTKSGGFGSKSGMKSVICGVEFANSAITLVGVLLVKLNSGTNHYF